MIRRATLFTTLFMIAAAGPALAQSGASAFALSYVLQTDQNVVPLLPGGAIIFSPTPINTSTQAALNIRNAGSGAGTIQNITIPSGAYSLAGLPSFPLTVQAGQSLQILVLYRPTGITSDTGQITISFDGGTSRIVNLQGSGSAATFVYEVQTNPPTVVQPGGTISLPNANVGQASSLTIRVLNSGNANGAVDLPSIAGQEFRLSNLPVFPQTLPPNASLTFTITFAPTQPGTFAGSLRINSDTFTLSGVGLGPKLEFSYVTGGSEIVLSPTNNSVIFSPVMVSQSAELNFRVRNTGTLPATISNIGISQTASPFSVSGLPGLPVSLAVNSDFRFTIVYKPTALGFANGTLQLDTTTVALVGSATAPPPLPAYTITGPSGMVAAMSQPRIGLTLGSTYPVAISGVLTLTVSGTLPPDPAVQFSAGGRTVQFTIPANSVDAIFTGQGAQIGLQTGTVTGAIIITPSFATQSGNVDLTPTAPTVLQLSVAPAAPTLLSIQLSNQTANGFVLGVTGFTTTRALRAWNLRFTPAAGSNISTGEFKIDIQQIATLWFGRASSQDFGSLFIMTIPINLQGAAQEGQSLAASIAGISMTMENELGVSNSLQTQVQ